MAISITYDPGDLSTPLNRIRDLIGDVDTSVTDPLEGLDDGEITQAYSDTGNIWAAAALCARKLAMRMARLNDTRAGDYEEKFSQRVKALRDLAADLEARYGAASTSPSAGQVEEAELEEARIDTTLVAPLFRHGKWDNPYAGGDEGDDELSGS